MDVYAGPQTVVRLRTNAKLNLFLRVVGTRPDGFHELESIFHGIGLGDDIEIESTDSRGVEIEMTLGPDLAGDLPSPQENLVGRAIQGLIDGGGSNPGVRIRITKRIPIAAGLGGGSGNAAGALVALSELWGMDLEPGDLMSIAARVGSDVPYCVGGGTALAMKRGEALTPLPAPKSFWFVLGVTFREVLTKDIYRAWDTMEPVDNAGSAPMAFAIGSGEPAEVAILLHNDLERPAFLLMPDLAEKKEAMTEAGALGSSMTGSGPTIFGMARDEAHARAIASKVEGRFDRVLVASSHPRCVERLD